MHCSTSQALMEGVVKTETTDATSPYDLEYRASEDDAWYSVCVLLDAGAEMLTVKYMCSPEVYEIVFHASKFRTEAELEELVSRFRPVSHQLQDHECLKLSVGTTVCAAHGTTDDDLRFYDAVVDAVYRRTHSFVGGEEECLCSFVLFWKHGRGHGTLTSVSIASICFLDTATHIDPRIIAFANMARKSHASITNDSESSQKRPLESEISMRLKSQADEMKDSAKDSSYNQCTNQDEDMGPKPCNTNDLATTDDHFFILINNLEKGLTASVIKSFIYEKTTILAEAYVFPSLDSDPFARGAIMVDSQTKAQTVHEFLDSPKHFVVSSKGRPWVITQKPSAGTFGASIRNIPPEEINHKRTDRELEVVVSGTKSYESAKQLRDLGFDSQQALWDFSRELVQGYVETTLLSLRASHRNSFCYLVS